MLPYFKLFLVTLVIPCTICWKPIVGPAGAPSTYTISTHSGLPESSKLIDQHAEHSSEDQTITTYHGNIFSHEDISGKAPSNLLLSEIIGEERIVGGKSTSILGSTKGYNGFYTDDECSVDKFAFEHEGTVKYDQSLPELEQLTLCTWMRFTNHSGDHTLLTYSVDKEPREIQLWVANSKGSSYLTMAVHGQSLFRLNYPLKMRVWHHACASWNGKTGEWQLWIKSERVGRGFHNRLVNYQIKPHGVLYSGGPSITGAVDEDLHFELTLLQIYKVALSAGKAHRDHKHHHVHHFDHNGEVSTPAPTRAPALPPQPISPLLANGQIPTRVRINLANGQEQNALNPGASVRGLPSQLVGGFLPSQQDGATVTTQFVNGQFHTGGRILQEQLVAGHLLKQFNAGGQKGVTTNILFPGSPSQAPSSYSDVHYIDSSAHKLFKREDKLKDNKKAVNKRELVMLQDGSIVDDSTLTSGEYIFDGLADFGLPDFKNKLGKSMGLEDEIREHDREPAEGEVQAVMHICSKCSPEPFQGAIIFAWKNIKTHTERTLSAKSSSVCGQF